MSRKKSSLPFRSQIWVCSLSNKFKKKKEKKKIPPVNCAYIITSYGLPGYYQTPPGQLPSVQLQLHWEKAATDRILELNQRLCAQWALWNQVLCSPSFVSSTTMAGQCQGKYCMKNFLENHKYF